jgi:hypothetical protein
VIPPVKRGDLAVVARYDRHGGIEIAGDSEDLLRLSDLIFSEEPEAVFSLRVPQTGDAAPYDGFLSSIKVSTGDQKVRIVRYGDSIHVVGSRTALISFSRSIRAVAEKAETPESRELIHIHVEFYEGHPFLESGSEPLTVALRGPDYD